MEFILSQAHPCLVVPKNFKTYCTSMHEQQKAALQLHVLLPPPMERGRKLKNDGGISICWDKTIVGLYQQNTCWE